MYSELGEIRHALKAGPGADIAGWVYRTVLPQSIRRSIIERSFQDCYGSRDEYRATIMGIDIVYSTEDTYSKRWFFPRYDGAVHEPTVTHLFVRKARDARCIVDVGANLGWFTCIGAAASRGTVFAFEMDGDNMDRLENNVALNALDDVVATQAAVSDVQGTTSYWKVPGAASPMHSLLHRQRGEQVKVTVPATTLDTFASERLDNLDLLKIDVEGAEYDVLSGAVDTLRDFQPTILLEVHPVPLEDMGAAPQRVMALLRDLGYSLFRVREHDRSEADTAHEHLNAISTAKPFQPKDNMVIYAEHQDSKRLT